MTILDIADVGDTLRVLDHEDKVTLEGDITYVFNNGDFNLGHHATILFGTLPARYAIEVLKSLPKPIRRGDMISYDQMMTLPLGSVVCEDGNLNKPSFIGTVGRIYISNTMVNFKAPNEESQKFLVVYIHPRAEVLQ